MTEDNLSLKDEIREMNRTVRELLDKNKPRSFRLPVKARVSKLKLRKGFATVQVINENKTIEFRREPIIDGTIKLNDTYHAIAELDIFNYKGKPFIMLPKNRLNPFNPINLTNQTYGQKYVMARMHSDAIKLNKGFGNIGWIIFILAIIGIAAYYFLGGKK